MESFGTLQEASASVTKKMQYLFSTKCTEKEDVFSDVIGFHRFCEKTGSVQYRACLSLRRLQIHSDFSFRNLCI